MMDLASTVARLVRGSRLVIPPGTYEGDITVHTPDVTLTCAVKGTVTIKGGTFGVRVLDGTTGVTIDGLRFIGQKKNPVYIKALCHRAAVRNCYMSGMGGSGILTANSHEVVCENNTIEDGEDHAIYHSQSGDRGRILNNTIRRVKASAIQVNSHDTTPGKGQRPGAPPEYDGISEGYTIRGNAIEASGDKGGAAINLSGCVDAAVEDNTIRGQRRGIGVAIFADDGGGKPCQRVTVRRNHIAVPGAAVQVMQGCKDCCVTADNVLVGSPQTDYHEHVRAA